MNMRANKNFCVVAYDVADNNDARRWGDFSKGMVCVRTSAFLSA